MHFHILPEMFFFSPEKGVYLEWPNAQVSNEPPQRILITKDIFSLTPTLPEFSGELFLITMTKHQGDFCGSPGFPHDGAVHVMGRPLRPPTLMTAVLGRFGKEWENIPLVERAIPIILSGRGSDLPESAWENFSFLDLTGAISRYLWDSHSVAQLYVGASDVLAQFPESWYIVSNARRENLVKAILMLPVNRSELAPAPHLLEWCTEHLEQIRQGLVQCEGERLKATQAFTDAIDEMMKGQRPLRDWERLHQTWQTANPESVSQTKQSEQLPTE